MNEPNVEQQHRSWLQAQAGWYQAGQEHRAQGCALQVPAAGFVRVHPQISLFPALLGEPAKKKTLHCVYHRIKESLRLEKTSNVMWP